MLPLLPSAEGYALVDTFPPPQCAVAAIGTEGTLLLQRKRLASSIVSAMGLMADCRAREDASRRLLTPLVESTLVPLTTQDQEALGCLIEAVVAVASALPFEDDLESFVSLDAIVDTVRGRAC